MKVPATVPETVSIEAPDPVTLVGLNAAVRLASDAAAVRLTTPENPLTAVTVIVEVPEPPAVKLIVVGAAEMVKSGAGFTVKLTEVE